MICIPLKEKKLSSLLQKIKQSQKLADVIEIWFDEIPGLTEEMLSSICKITNKPLMYKYMGNSENLKLILGKFPAYIDFDYLTDKKIINETKKYSPKTKIILSFHDYKGTAPSSELMKTVKSMQLKGADIVKLATTAKSLTDSFRMLSVLGNLNENGQKSICLCMGKEGRITRVAGHLFGNYLMYAALTAADRTASGQLLAKELKQIHALI